MSRGVRFDPCRGRRPLFPDAGLGYAYDARKEAGGRNG
jgi:hypothetical protein